MKKPFGTLASRKVIAALEYAGYEAVFVGGSVRDHLLHRTATDFDIATSAQPHEVKVLFPNTVDLGTEHGTVLVVMDQEPIEVTTYRTDGIYSDHRRPDEVEFVRSLKEDLLRRDFTMNALALTDEGELIDLFGGKMDLDRRLIRAVGVPADRFKEDALRMLRAVRFASVLDFTIEEATLHAIRSNSSGIRHVSVERIKAEMDKLFIGLNPAKALRYIVDTGLHIYLPLFPDVVDRFIAPLPFAEKMVGWASLMIAGHFGPLDVAKAYKLSTSEKRFLVNVHEAYLVRQERLYTVEDFYKNDVHVLLVVERFHACFDGKANSLSEKRIRQAKSSLPIHSKKDIVITGKDLIHWTGKKSGPWIGEWMDRIEKAILHNACENDRALVKEWFLHEYRR